MNEFLRDYARVWSLIVRLEALGNVARWHNAFVGMVTVRVSALGGPDLGLDHIGCTT